MKKIFLISAALVSQLGLVGCLESNNDTTAAPNLPAALTVKHIVEECPQLSGDYYREYEDNGEIQRINLSIKLELKNDILMFFDGKNERTVDGSSHKNELEALNYESGCDNGALVVQQSVAGKPLAELKYSIENDSLVIRAKSLDEEVLQINQAESIWKKAEKPD